MSKEVTLERYDDSPLEGPRTAVHMMKRFERHGGDPRQWLSLWTREKRLDSSDRPVHEMRVLTNALSYLGSYDQVNIGALLGAEVLCPSAPGWAWASGRSWRTF